MGIPFTPLLRNMTALHRLMPALRSPLLPFAFLLLALSTVFIFGGNRGHFYRGYGHDLVSAEHLTVAVNRSFEHGLAGFHRKTIDEDGNPTYTPYNRFPVGGYLSIKLATLPFSGSLSGQIMAARILMLLFFAAAAVMAYLSLCRLASNRWVALTATLLGFSSYYVLYYNDAIATELTADLFGVMLTFHGMVVFMQEGRFRQLLIKTCIALLLGWHVFALLLPFVIFGLASELLRAGSASATSSSSLYIKLKHASSALIQSRYLLLGVAALLFGVSILALNFGMEYASLNGRTPLMELPSFKSMAAKTPARQVSNDALAWGNFLEGQFYRIGGMSLPYYYFTSLGKIPFISFKSQQIIIATIITGACLIGLMFVHQRILFATLASFGFFWALPMRNSTSLGIHDFESIYYIGIPLVFFSLVLLYIRKMSSDRLIIGTSIAALLIFTGSSFQMARAEYNAYQSVLNEADTSEFHEAVIADFEGIRDLTNGKVVFVPHEDVKGTTWHKRPRDSHLTGVPYGAAYYLTGSTILYSNEQENMDLADFFVTFGHEDGYDTLTPENQIVFLYYMSDYQGANFNRFASKSAYNRSVYSGRISELSDPIIESDYTVYRLGNDLVYVGCQNIHARFFLHVRPIEENDLLYRNRIIGFDNIDFSFSDFGWRTEEGCFAVRSLPQYDVARISTGQFSYSHGVLWSDVFDVEAHE